MINLKFKDIKKRKLVTQYENSKFIMHLIHSNKNFKSSIQSNLSQFKNRNISKNSCVVRLTKRCVISNNNKTIHSQFKLSRSIFLKFARLNLIFGLRKTSW